MVEKAHTAAGHETGFWPNLLDPLRAAGARVADFFAPSSDAAATPDSYEVNVELPGVAREDVSVELDGNVLSVKGTKRSSHEEEGRTYYFSERRYGEFHRTFRLPEDVNPDDVSATFKDGLLTLRIPKRSAPDPRRRQVPVE